MKLAEVPFSAVYNRRFMERSGVTPALLPLFVLIAADNLDASLWTSNAQLDPTRDEYDCYKQDIETDEGLVTIEMVPMDGNLLFCVANEADTVPLLGSDVQSLSVTPAQIALWRRQDFGIPRIP